MKTESYDGNASNWPPLGTFDDDPGGPWIGPGVRCHCAAGRPDKCPGPECPHHMTNRPGFESSDQKDST